MHIEVKNNGQELIETNYWQTAKARAGYIYVTINAGCLRVLVPSSAVVDIEDMRTGKVVLATRGIWQSEKGQRDAIELLFEDYSDSPYCLHLVVEQFDMVPATADRDRPGDDPRWKIAVYTESGKQFELPARYRLAKKLPYLRPWSK